MASIIDLNLESFFIGHLISMFPTALIPVCLSSPSGSGGIGGLRVCSLPLVGQKLMSMQVRSLSTTSMSMQVVVLVVICVCR